MKRRKSNNKKPFRPVAADLLGMSPTFSFGPEWRTIQEKDFRRLPRSLRKLANVVCSIQDPNVLRAMYLATAAEGDSPARAAVSIEQALRRLDVASGTSASNVEQEFTLAWATDVTLQIQEHFYRGVEKHVRSRRVKRALIALAQALSLLTSYWSICRFCVKNGIKNDVLTSIKITSIYKTAVIVIENSVADPLNAHSRCDDFRRTLVDKFQEIVKPIITKIPQLRVVVTDTMEGNTTRGTKPKNRNYRARHVIAGKGTRSHQVNKSQALTLVGFGMVGLYGPTREELIVDTESWHKGTAPLLHRDRFPRLMGHIVKALPARKENGKLRNHYFYFSAFSLLDNVDSDTAREAKRLVEKDFPVLLPHLFKWAGSP